MKISSLAISLFVFMGVALGLSYFYGGMVNTYTTLTPELVNSSSHKNFTYASGFADEVSDIVSSVENKTLQIGGRNWLYNLASTVIDTSSLIVDTAGLLLKIPNAMIGMINQTLKLIKIPIPTWFITMIFAIIVIFVVLKVVGVFLKRDI